MPANRGPSPLPQLYAPWIEEVLGGSVPEETHATCSACAMCTPHAENAMTASLTVFDPDTKCCTYVPTLPNFLVGLILSDDDPSAAAGRASVEQRIVAGIGVTPLGLQSDPRYALIYKHAGGELFGQSAGLRCPHYLPAGGGQCGIWRHRNAVCSTWFCKYERGKVARSFWDALLQFLTMTERHLALWAAARLGASVDGLGAALLPYYATASAPYLSSRSEGWRGRAGDFYRECAQLVQVLSWAEVRAIGGPELALLAGRLRSAYGAMQSGDVPQVLRLGAVALTERGDGTCAVAGYSTSDMPVLPAALAATLSLFDGRRSTDEVGAEILRTVGIQLDHAFVRRLVDFGILLVMPRPRDGHDQDPHEQVGGRVHRDTAVGHAD